ncbi:MAG: hypothetical protein ACYS1A_17820 [Planctomycetota bacterium]|jgi:hypothetical protein
MPLEYTDQTQFLEAYSAEPIFYAFIKDDLASPTVVHEVGITSLVLENNAGDLTAVYGNAMQFGDIVEAVSEDIQATTATIGLDAFTFTTSLLGWYVEIYLGATTLKTEQHLLLYTGQILSENRNRRIYGINIQEGVYLTLMKEYFPKFQIKDEFSSGLPADAFDKYVPVVFGELLTVNGSKGRLTAIPITNVTGGPNDFLVCQYEAGAGWNVPNLWQNGTLLSVGWGDSQVNGTAFDYIKVTVTSSEPDDEITVDVFHKIGDNPITLLQNFLTNALWLNIPTTSLDTASFTAANTVATSRNYEAGGKIEEPTQALQIIADWLRSFAAQAVVSAGNFGVRIRDYTYDFNAPDFHEGAHILKGSGSVNAGVENIINTVNYQASFDFANTAFVQGIISDSASVTQWERRERSIALPWAKNDLTASDVAARMVFDNKDPRNRISLRTFLKAAGNSSVGINILDTIRVTTENVYRRYCEIIRRTLSGSNFGVALELLDIDDLVTDAFRLGAEESKAADVPHSLPANDQRNCSVTGSIDDSGTLTTGAGTDTLSRAGGVSFVTRGVKVGDFVTLFQLAGGTTPVNLGVYEIYEGALAIGTPITTAATLTVEDPNTGAAVSFTGAEVVTYWWIARSWATADADQQRQGYITDAAGLMSDGSPGKTLT